MEEEEKHKKYVYYVCMSVSLFPSDRLTSQKVLNLGGGYNLQWLSLNYSVHREDQIFLASNWNICFYVVDRVMHGAVYNQSLFV